MNDLALKSSISTSGCVQRVCDIGDRLRTHRNSPFLKTDFRSQKWNRRIIVDMTRAVFNPSSTTRSFDAAVVPLKPLPSAARCAADDLRLIPSEDRAALCRSVNFRNHQARFWGIYPRFLARVHI